MAETINLILVSVLLFVVSLELANAGGVLLTPKMIIRVNITSSEEIEITRAIGVRNDENFQLNVSLDVSDTLKEIIRLEEEKFILEPNEEKWVNFTLKIKEEGKYYGEVISVFSAENKQPVGLASQIIVLAEEETGGGTSEITGQAVTDEQISKNFLIVAIMTIILLVVLFILMVRFKKSREKIEEKGRVKLRKGVKRHG